MQSDVWDDLTLSIWISMTKCHWIFICSQKCMINIFHNYYDVFSKLETVTQTNWSYCRMLFPSIILCPPNLIIYFSSLNPRYSLSAARLVCCGPQGRTARPNWPSVHGLWSVDATPRFHSLSNDQSTEPGLRWPAWHIADTKTYCESRLFCFIKK